MRFECEARVFCKHSKVYGKNAKCLLRQKTLAFFKNCVIICLLINALIKKSRTIRNFKRGFAAGCKQPILP